MGDTGDDFRAWKEHGQKKRTDNREHSPKILESEGIRFDRKNMGAHLIVHGNDETIDFWPGTGKWIVRGGKTSRGVFPLIKYIKTQTFSSPKTKGMRADFVFINEASDLPPWEE
ncbi:MAG: hypothetical protein GY739_05300 [Mesoflavibacter sp.]|nr:hypothetical protein [Mesoflavibacter sp.]